MGLERISAVMEGVVDNYQTFEFKNIISIIKNCLEINGVVNSASLNVIADHVRAISFLILENVLPSNEGRGYVIRRIIRRAIRHLYLISGLNKDKIVLYKIVEKFIEYKKNDEKYLYQSKNSIVDVVKKEELKFLETFENGIYLINKELENISNGGLFSGEIAFKLFDTYGFPLDLTEDILKEKNILVDKKSFIKNMEKQQEMGKKSWNKEKEDALITYLVL
jgi:alanyl-tRNA synthetase